MVPFQFYINVCLFGCLILATFAERESDPRFIAARKGDPPPCRARPGQTFCEHVEDYPYEVVLNAIKRSKFDITKLLVDESTDDGPDLSYTNSGLSLNGHLPLPQDTTSLSENTLFDDDLIERPNFNRNELTHEDIQKRLNRIPRNASLRSVEGNETTTLKSVLHRRKRQNLDPLPPLCKFRSQYIYPQAAMCARTGEWMYIVNAPKMFGNLSQMIKTELCDPSGVGRSCMGYCEDSNLPFGIVSRCQQRYVQKRLVTLAGVEIATDMFWLPTCCVCGTSRRNN